MPNALSWMPAQILRATELFQEGRPSDAVTLSVQAVQPMPRRLGAADALALVGKAYLQVEQAHQGEVACLMSVRLAPTLINPDLLFDNLVNLTFFNLRLKSFEEAYAYGRLAERLRTGDPDLEANLVGACALTGRTEEALERFERLKHASPVKAGMVQSYFSADGPAIPETTPTRHLDCSDLLPRIRDAATQSRIDEFHSALTDLQQRPDGNGARDCWLEVYRFYCNSLAAADWDEYQVFQGYAGVVASTGKVISADREAAEKDATLWVRRGVALAELRLYELAVPVLEHALTLAPGETNSSRALEDCREILRLREATASDPWALLEAARHAARDRYRFWFAYDLFAEAFARANRSIDERSEQSHTLHHQGVELFGSDKDQAIALLSEAAANLPEISHTWQELGTLYFSIGQFAAAEQFLSYAVELVASSSPPPVDAGRFWSNRANCRLNRAASEPDMSPEARESKRDQAAADARRAIELGDERARSVLQQLGGRQGGARAVTRQPQGCLGALAVMIAIVMSLLLAS